MITVSKYLEFWQKISRVPFIIWISPTPHYNNVLYFPHKWSLRIYMKYHVNCVYSYLCLQKTYCSLLRKHDFSESPLYVMQFYLRWAAPDLRPDTHLYLLIRSFPADQGIRDPNYEGWGGHISRLQLLNIEGMWFFKHHTTRTCGVVQIWPGSFVNSSLWERVMVSNMPREF